MERKILVVDDEKDILVYLREELGNQYHLTLADGGGSALAALGRETFHVVLTDIRMPGIDGLQVLRAAKQMAPECEVILMSGYADIHVVIEAMNEHAFGFLTKPLLREILHTRIGDAMAVIRGREDRRQVLQELQENLLEQTQFAQRLSALAAMSGGIGHELNQPLSGIRVYTATLSRMLEKKKPVDETYLRDTLEKINQQVDRAITFIEHIREFSSGKQSQEEEPVDLLPAVSRALELFTMQLQGDQIALELEIPPDLRVFCNRHRLEQVVLNLVANARDSMRPVSPGGASPGLRRIRLRAWRENAQVWMDVEDTGSGVPEEMRGTLFDPFVTGKKLGQGTGLGLFISRKILQNAGGSLELLATGPQGTVFRIKLPLNVPQPS